MLFKLFKPFKLFKKINNVFLIDFVFPGGDTGTIQGKGEKSTYTPPIFTEKFMKMIIFNENCFTNPYTS